MIDITDLEWSELLIINIIEAFEEYRPRIYIQKSTRHKIRFLLFFKRDCSH